LYQGEKGDDFKLLIKELDTKWKTLDYLFIDDSHNFSNFILGSNYLYDILVRVFNKKVVIAGSMLSIYLTNRRSLFGRCSKVRVPHLSFYEHCSLVLQKEPTTESFLNYLQSGGLFSPCDDLDEYIQTGIADNIKDIFDKDRSAVDTWLKPISDNVDWQGYTKALLLWAGNFGSHKARIDGNNWHINPDSMNAVTLDFLNFCSKSKNHRDLFGVKPTEATSLLNYFIDCGVVAILQNLFSDIKSRLYVEPPFLRFHFANKPQDYAILRRGSPLLDDLLEAALVSEYKSLRLDSKTYFARVPYPNDSSKNYSGRLEDILLLDAERKKGYAIERSDAQGSSILRNVNRLPQLEGYKFTLLNYGNIMNQLYLLGKECADAAIASPPLAK
jgi:hypothetical protein